MMMLMLMIQAGVEAAVEAGTGVQRMHVAAVVKCSILVQLLVEAALEAGYGVLQIPGLVHDPVRAVLIMAQAWLMRLPG